MGRKEWHVPLDAYLAKFAWPNAVYIVLIVWFSAMAVTVTVLWRLSFPSEIFERELTLWIVPGWVSSVLTILAFRWLGLISRQRKEEFRRFLPTVHRKGILDLLLKYKLHVLGGAIAAVAVGLFRLDALFINPDQWVVGAFASEYGLASAASVLHVINPSVAWFIFGTFVSLFLGAIILFGIVATNAVNSANLRPFDQDHMSGLSFLATYGWRLLLLWVIPPLPMLRSFALSVQTWWSQSILIMFIIATVGIAVFIGVYFYAPVNSGREMVQQEIDQLSSNSRTYWDHDVTEQPEETTEKVLLEAILINARLQFLRDWEASIKVWPFRVGLPGFAVLVSSVPLIQSVLTLTPL